MPEAPAATGTVRDFLVPDLGEGLEEATIVEWRVAPGDTVVLNQPLCTVETAKAEVEVPSPYAGTVVALGGAADETLKVGTLLARIEVAGGAGGGEPASGRQATLVGYGHDESIDRSRRRRGGAARSKAPDAPEPAAAAVATTPAKPLAKPPVRKLAHDLGVDLASVTATGPDGIVTRDDVRAAADAPAPTAPTAATATTAPVPTAVRPVSGTDQVIPVRGVRARIAERMTTSRTHIPDATCSVVVDCTRLMEVRVALNAAAERRGLAPVVTPFALVCRFLVQAVQAVPLLNATFVEEVPEIRVHGQVHLGIGTATERGLVVAVVKDAGRRSTLDLATEINRLATGAREGTLAPTELIGSTITVSNFGALGLDEGVPVINHPEAAIVGMGSIKPRPFVVDGEIVARRTMSITLAFDHRVGDGAEAGRFLSLLRELVEAPELALLDA